MQASEEELQAGGKEKFLSVLVGQSVLVCLGSLTLLWFFSLWNVWAIVLLLNVLIDPWIGAQQVLYERNFQYKNLSLVESGSHFVSHVFSVVGVLGGLGPAVLYLRGWVQTLGRLLGLCYVRGFHGFQVRWLSLKEWRSVFLQLRGYWLEGWLKESFGRLVIMVLGFLEGPQMTGYFFQARALARTPHQLLQPIFIRIMFNFLSHRVSARRGVQVLQEVLTVLIPLLILIAVIATLAADRVIPWLFGPRWEPVVPIFQAMVGILIGLTPYNMLGVYFKAQNYMWPFIAFGQGFQYGALAVGLLVGLLLNFSAAYALAVGLSVGYVGGFFLLTITLRLLQHKFDKKVSIVKE